MVLSERSRKILINADGKALEWCCGSWLADDKKAIDEIINGLDAHSDNQHTFGLPSRLIAKKFLFRLIYGGSAYSYAHDVDFEHVSTSEKYWQRAIDAFHEKYKGWSRWWIRLLQEATSTGKVVSPLGRVWEYKPYQNYRKEWVWPETTIKNYIIQGTSADLMSIARVLFAKKFYEEEVRGKLIATVHDSIVCDVEEQETERVCMMLIKSFNEVPAELFKRMNVSYTLPFNAEVQYGLNLKNMTEFK